MEIRIPFGEELLAVNVPDGTEVLESSLPEVLENPGAVLLEALKNPIASKAFGELAKEKYAGPDTRACIVVSDNTRPVPYKGENGILMPLIQQLLECGYHLENICVLIATGTHAAMSYEDIIEMIGIEPFEAGVEIINHDCRREKDLCKVGVTGGGTEAYVNRRYMEADFKILTGLVESHFMAGASGGRKSVCPGIFGETGTFIFHGPRLMADENSRDLNLEGNLVHRESLDVAKMAGVDFIVNVTLDKDFHITGVFCGELEKAHEAAVEKLKTYVAIPFEEEYDLIITHAGFVGRNHYQAAKSGVEASYAIKEGGAVVMLANNHDRNPIGSDRYLAMCALLKQVGAEGFNRAIKSPEWTFLPDQWQVQMWTKLFRKVELKDFIYYAPQLDAKDWRCLPGVDGSCYVRGDAKTDGERAASVVEAAVKAVMEQRKVTAEDVQTGKFRIAYLAEGPYAVPMKVYKE